MEQVAHQAVVMQFIIEIAKNCNVDPRGCFRLFFQKAKVSDCIMIVETLNILQGTSILE